jgi:hypothetical protein
VVRVSVTRRTFIAAGVAGAAALALAQWWREAPDPRERAQREAEADAIVAAIVPAMLEDALPPADPQRSAAIAQTVAGVRRAIAGLPPAAQRELDELFALLAFAPARVALAGVGTPWSAAPTGEISEFLERWRTSRFTLPRAAYGALHQLLFGAWYAQPEAWAAIGYTGPPRLRE